MTKNNGSKKKKKKIKLLWIVCLSILFWFLFVLLGTNLIIKSLKVNGSEKLYFVEKGDVNYLVCLKDNNFFEDQCLNSNMSYVASLINNISLNFNYQFNGNIDDLINNVDYQVNARLIIENIDTKAKYYEKDFELVSKTDDIVSNNGTLYNLNKNINIDYEYFNNIANSFKSQYGVNSQSYLEVYLNINKYSSYQDIPKSSLISVKIPLSQKAIEIKFNTHNLNNSIDKSISSKSLIINGYFKFIIGVFLLLFSFVFLVVIVMIINNYRKKVSKYNKFINKILREYDRLIVETSTIPNYEDYNVLIINSFNELVDVRDNLRSPIMYCDVVSEKESLFYIINDNNLYLYMVNEININNGEKKI